MPEVKGSKKELCFQQESKADSIRKVLVKCGHSYLIISDWQA